MATNPDDAAERPGRQCSRCRTVFPADETLLFTAEHAWWLCPACREALIGKRNG